MTQLSQNTADMEINAANILSEGANNEIDQEGLDNLDDLHDLNYDSPVDIFDCQKDYIILA